jgi:ABC-type branched-subunit amino acid transport system substrate-binding protein
MRRSIGPMLVVCALIAAGCSSSKKSSSSTGSTAATSGTAASASAPGVTATTITVGNVASVSGPVPGIFQGAPNGVDAFFAYINSEGGVNGRKLQMKFGDDAFNCNQNATQVQSLMPSVFAFVGSFSVSDNCSAPVFAKNPDVADLAYVLDTDMENLPNNFSVSPQPPGWRTGPYLYYKQKYPDHLNVGSLYSNSAGGTFSWHGMRAAAESVGYKMVYERAVAATETDFTADVLRMRAAGVNFLATSGLDPNSIARLVNAVRQQKWDPLIEAGGSVYAVDYLKLFNAGAGEGVLQDQAFAMFLGEDAATTPEVGLFDTWMKKAHPGFPLDLFAMFGWAEARLFVEALKAAGPNPTQPGLIAALKNIHHFDSNGLIAPVDPAGKVPPSCWLIITIKNNAYERITPDKGFTCEPGGYFRYNGT